MHVDIKATNMDVSSEVKAYVIDKVGSIDQYLDSIIKIDVEVGRTTNHHNKGDVFFCEVNVSVPRTLLRYREETEDLYSAINSAKKGIQNEIKKYKEKQRGL